MAPREQRDIHLKRLVELRTRCNHIRCLHGVDPPPTWKVLKMTLIRHPKPPYRSLGCSTPTGPSPRNSRSSPTKRISLTHLTPTTETGPRRLRQNRISLTQPIHTTETEPRRWRQNRTVTRLKTKDSESQARANRTIKNPTTEQEHGPLAASPPSNLSSMHAYYGEEDKHKLKYLQMRRPVLGEPPPAETIHKSPLPRPIYLPYEFRLRREIREGERKQAWCDVYGGFFRQFVLQCSACNAMMCLDCRDVLWGGGLLEIRKEE